MTFYINYKYYLIIEKFVITKHRKTPVLAAPWASNIPKRYKRNTIIQIYIVLSEFELIITKNKFLAALYSHKFTNSVINTFY